MANEDLSLRFGVDVSGLVAGIDTVKASIVRLKNEVKQLTASVSGVAAAMGREFERTARQAEEAAMRMRESWGRVFDRLGGDIQSSLDRMLFDMPLPRRWYAQSAGPGGAPLLTMHEISGPQQVLFGLERAMMKDTFNAVSSGLMKSFASAIFGAGTKSFGAGIAGLIGIGKPGGLFGTGLGAASGLTQTAVMTANTTAVGALTAAVTANTVALGGATAASGASATGGALSAAGAAGGVFSGLKTVGGWILGLFSQGGIVPSAAGGWALPSFAGSMPALLHSREMVLPADISEGLQNVIRGEEAVAEGGGGDVHLHFHGPADQPSIASWLAGVIGDNPAPFVRALRGTAFRLG